MWFFLFVLSIAINCSFTLYFACYCIAIEGIQLLYVLGLIEAFVFCGLGWILTCTSVSDDAVIISSLSQSFVNPHPGAPCLYESHDERDVQLQEILVSEGQARTLLKPVQQRSGPQSYGVFSLSS